MAAKKEVGSKSVKKPLSDAERLRFATALYAARQANPSELWKDSFVKASLTLPPARRMQGKGHPSEVTWLPALLTQIAQAAALANPAEAVIPAKKSERVMMTEEDKLAFARVVYKLRQLDPPKPWSHCIKEARGVLRDERQIGANIDHPNHIPWLKPMLAQFDETPQLLKKNEARPLRDMRQTLPLVPPAPERVEPVVPGRKTKVFLRGLEQIAFAEAVYKTRKLHPRWGWRDVMAEANKVLSVDRQVTAAHPTNLSWLNELLEEIETRPDPVPAPSAIKIEEAPKPKEEEPREVVASAVLVGTALPAQTTDLYDLIISAIVGVVKQSVVQIVQSPRLQDEIRAAIHPTPQALGEPVMDRRTKVLVVGLLPVQANDIETEFGGSLDLRFFDSTVTSDQIENAIKHVDFAVLMTKFTSHKTQQKMRGHSGFMFCNGNSSALKSLLREKVMALQ